MTTLVTTLRNGNTIFRSLDDNTVVVRNIHGSITRVVDARGNEREMSYSPSGTLESIRCGDRLWLNRLSCRLFVFEDGSCLIEQERRLPEGGSAFSQSVLLMDGTEVYTDAALGVLAVTRPDGEQIRLGLDTHPEFAPNPLLARA